MEEYKQKIKENEENIAILAQTRRKVTRFQEEMEDSFSQFHRSLERMASGQDKQNLRLVSTISERADRTKRLFRQSVTDASYVFKKETQTLETQQQALRRERQRQEENGKKPDENKILSKQENDWETFKRKMERDGW
ncbi:MAG: hypothetical protein LBI13_08800 [Streptococcaceae bacterium]|jgi:hypothetical protein|nr:hypothetical protein [Streptococcaceae bacterium]